MADFDRIRDNAKLALQRAERMIKRARAAVERSYERLGYLHQKYGITVQDGDPASFANPPKDAN